MNFQTSWSLTKNRSENLEMRLFTLLFNRQLALPKLDLKLLFSQIDWTNKYKASLHGFAGLDEKHRIIHIDRISVFKQFSFHDSWDFLHPAPSIISNNVWNSASPWVYVTKSCFMSFPLVNLLIDLWFLLQG